MFIPTDVWREAAEWKSWGAAVSTTGGHTHVCSASSRLHFMPFKGFFFMQLDGAATRGHHEITALDVVIVKITDGDVNIEIF